jgi:hypothetical protein
MGSQTDNDVMNRSYVMGISSYLKLGQFSRSNKGRADRARSTAWKGSELEGRPPQLWGCGYNPRNIFQIRYPNLFILACIYGLPSLAYSVIQ